MVLYDYYRSSCAYRVRLALNLKALDYQQIPVNLVTAEQSSLAHQQLTTEQLVPVFRDDGITLTQSLAICEYLDEAYPHTYALITGSVYQRCAIRAFALAIACEIHPINNLRVLKYLKSALAIDETGKNQWYQHWINTTFVALESQLKQRSDPTLFCCSDQPSLAEVCLIPQIYNARRFNVDMEHYPNLLTIERRCQSIAAFNRAHPDQQPDAK